MATKTETKTYLSNNDITMREFFDKNKIPYALCRLEFFVKDGIKKKIMVKGTEPPLGWEKHSYETMMAINDMKQRTGDNTLVANLRTTRFCVLDADDAAGEEFLIKNYPGGNFSESVSRQMPHKYLVKHAKDVKGKNQNPYRPGLDLVYNVIFEGINAIMIGYDEASFLTFNDFNTAVMPTNTPASNLQKRERIFDPTILDIIDSKFFSSGNYSDWLRICWSIIYCWGEIEGRLLCLKYSTNEDYTETETNKAVEKLLYDYNPTKNTPTFGSLCFYAKESNELLYEKWKKKNMETSSRTIREVALKMNLAEFKPRITRCDGDYYFKPDVNKPDWIKGDIEVKRALRRDIIFKPEKYNYYIEKKDKESGEPNGEYVLQSISRVKETDECVRDGMDIIEEDTQFINKMWENSLGKICFNNGVYDFKIGDFVPYGTHNTLIKVDRDFLPHDPIIRQEIYDKVINPIFGDDPTKRDAFLYNMAVAMAGDITHKKWLHVQGERGSGKGVTCDFMAAFGDYVREINTSCFYKKSLTGDKDEAKAKSFLIPLQHARLVYANEMDEGVILNGTSIKAFCSGGDRHQVRANYKDEITIRLQAMLMILSNDFPKIEPVDAVEKLISYDMKSVFLTGDENEDRLPNVNYQKADMSLRLVYLNRDDIKNEICHIIFDAYKNKVMYNYAPPIQDEDNASIGSIIKESFKVDATDRVSNKDLKLFITDMKMAVTLQKVNKYISAFFPSAKTYRTNGDRGWDGISLTYDDQ